MREARLPRTGIHAPQPLDDVSGSSRALNFQQRYRKQQAARVKPALAAFAEQRRIRQAIRRMRWMKNREAPEDLLRAPRHIQGD
jgi:hypothetical protein